MAEISRREFVKRSAQGLALAAVPLAFQFDPTAAFATPGEGTNTVTDYYEHFGVNESIIRQVMAAAMEKGGDYCDLFFQHNLYNQAKLEDDVVSKAVGQVNFGVGIRVLKGDQTGFSFTEEVTPEAMKLAAKTAANIASGTKSVPPQNLNFHEAPNYYKITTPWEDVGIDQKIPILQKLNAKIKALDPSIIKTIVVMLNDTSYIMCANSEGRVTADYQPLTRLIAITTIEKNGQREQGHADISARDGLEFYTPEQIDYVAQETVRRTLVGFEAIKPQGGEMPVVLAAGSSGILLHEAIGHGLEADANRKGTSIYTDKMNQKVAEDFVTIVDNGQNENVRGSINVDDEGNDSQNTVLIENGVLRSYMHDRISAKHYGVKPTGNGRRESFRFSPLPRMRNTYMLPGPHTREEIIQSVKKGVYAEVFTNGQVLIGQGDFTFYVKLGYLIEDGKLTAPVKDINLIGNGPRVLENVTMVADDFQLSRGGWNCGKDGQSVPVSLGLPTVKASAITVGGVS